MNFALIDSQSNMKKCNNDIGRRLSEMLVSNDAGKRLSEDFCMLTIDLRHVKQRTSAIQTEATQKIHNLTPSVSRQSSRVSIALSTSNDQDSSSYKKSHLFHKLTCSLFLRKHVCSSCKRKSRCFLSNRTLRKSEKRYICYRCREKSQIITNDSGLSNSSSGPLFVSHSKDNSFRVPRKHIKDSGYDTVTSCSTLASGYSSFSTPATTRQNTINEKTSSKPVLYGDNDLVSKRNTSTFKLNSSNRNKEPTAHIPQEYRDPGSEETEDSETELNTILDTPGFPDDHFTQAKKRHVQRYNEYVPNMDLNSWDQKKSNSVLSDTDDSSENGDSCYFPPRIIRLSPSGKSTSSEKACYTCDSTTKPCFRLPWEGGWVCEDCLDGLH